MSVKDDALDPIDPSLTGAGCAGGAGGGGSDVVYQRTDFHILASFSDGTVTVTDLDVTCEVSVSPNATGIVTVSGGQIVGIANGTVALTAPGFSAAMTTPPPPHRPAVGRSS